MVQFEVLRCLGIVLINVDNTPRNNKYASKFKFQTMKLQNLEQFYQIFFTLTPITKKAKKVLITPPEHFPHKEIVLKGVIWHLFFEIG